MRNLQWRWIAHLLGQFRLTVGHGSQIKSLELLSRQCHRRRDRGKDIVPMLCILQRGLCFAVLTRIAVHFAFWVVVV